VLFCLKQGVEKDWILKTVKFKYKKDHTRVQNLVVFRFEWEFKRKKNVSDCNFD